MCLDELAKTLSKKEKIHLYCDNSLQTHLRRHDERKQVVFISDFDFKDIQKRNGNILRFYKIDYPSISNGEVMLKMHHVLSFDFDRMEDYNQASERLTEDEKTAARWQFQQIRQFEQAEPAERVSGYMEITWTCVTFKFNPNTKNFDLLKSETITKF